MAPSKTAKGKARLTPKSSSPSSDKPPNPFQIASESLKPLTDTLDPSHIYLAHLDPRPSPFKRKIFLVPVAMNLFVILLFFLRARYIFPWYLQLLQSFSGLPNATTLVYEDLTTSQYLLVLLRRALTFLLDFSLCIFVWPWPYEFLVGNPQHGSPCYWRFKIGFRNSEIYVRRSRKWDEEVLGKGKDLLANDDLRKVFWNQIRTATNPMLLQQKTGYLTMDANWDLDWAGMVNATALVDKKEIEERVFGTLVLVYHERFGWMSIDLSDTGAKPGSAEDERRKQVFKFRDALAAIGQEDLFFRWIEVVQFETGRPGGFTQERQVEVAQKIRDMFKEKDVDFDEFWKEAVGTEGLAGMP
ncbi:hypothetical protein QBC40DRAFT_274591 [Triangularia verruculosa]|uniref:Uncharacterized protein n=1 Tax=Triangularia verruculosa TaxID=2587418 RepID=A0AAN6XND5_9PEZI|nr:hypothetical protein QBC40DRAFT_274591 [Triangularia verruculosa]